MTGRKRRAALLASLGMTWAGAAHAQEAVPGEVLVRVRAEAFAGNHLRAMVQSLGVIAGGQDALHAVRLRLQPGVPLQTALAQLRQQADVLYAEPNYVAHVLATPSDPYYAAYQYAPQITQTDKAWDLWTPHAQTVIAIVDTGIETAHPDLTNKIDRDAQGHVVGYDFIHNTTGAEDDNGHGTHCAGIAAAQTDSGIGIAGVAAWNGHAGQSDTQDIKVMPVKVMDSTGTGTYAQIAAGILWAADHGAKVISLSLGGPQDSQTLDDAVTYAWNKGCLICAAAGNSGTAAPNYPAACAHVLSVAATDSTDTLASYSNSGPWVKMAAPGSGIASTWIGDQYAMATGTSMASPFVAGEAALVWSDVPSLTNDKLSALLVSNVDPVHLASGQSLAAGVGRANVYKALLAATSAGATSPVTPSVPATPAPAQDPLVSAAFSATTVKGGQPVQLTLMLKSAVTSSPETITLTSSGGVSFPAQVSVPVGKIGVALTFTPPAVSKAATLTVTASAQGGKQTATLTIQPPAVRTFTLNAAQITGGTSVVGTLVLDSPAPVGGFLVALTSHGTAATTAATATIPAGSASVTFPVTTRTVTTATTITLTAGGKTAPLTITPAAKTKQH